MGSKKRRSSSVKKSSVGVETPPVGPPCEFRNGENDAWYIVNLVLQGETLLVKYREFSGDADEEFHAGDLTTSDKITSFRRRFRPLSKQLEAFDCWIVQQGMMVCALRHFAEDDRRYYDAIVEAVMHNEHTTVNGIEKCSCSFVLSWLQGPEAGTLTSVTVEDLCPLQSCLQLDPRLACFLQIAKWKHGIASPSSNIFGDDDNHDQQPPLSSSKHTHSYVTQKSDTAQKIQIASLHDKGDLPFVRNEDVDLDGGDCILSNVKRSCENPLPVDTVEDFTYIDSIRGEYCGTGLVQGKASSKKGEEDGHYSCAMDRLVKDVSYIDLQRQGQIKINSVHKNDRYFILVENLEIDVSPSTIVDFVRDATLVDVEVVVLLALSSEPYTRGVLVVDSLDELEMLCDFVGRQDQMIISSKGRPWIVPTSSVTDQAIPYFWCLEPSMKETTLHSTGSQLKIVKLGSEEFRRAGKLKELFLEFSKHQEQLFKSLALEEKKILNSSNCFSSS